MLSLPDFREKQIIFIDAYDKKEIKFRNDNLLIQEGGQTVNQIPFANIFTIFIVGEVTLTSILIKKAISHGVMLVLSNNNLSVYAVIGGETEGNFLLREKQYSDKNNLEKSKHIIKNKIANQVFLLKKKRKKTEDEKIAIQQCKNILQKVREVQNAQELLGFEGNAAKIFFSSYFQPFKWFGRKPRTKFDEVNVLLDIGYTYLFNFIDANLRLYGFDTYKGFYHTFFFQRKSLVCDLVEPFRCIIDQALLKAFNLRQFDKNDFEIRKNQYHIKRGCGKKYTRIFLEAIMSNKEEIFIYIQKYYRNIIKEGDDHPTFNLEKC